MFPISRVENKKRQGITSYAIRPGNTACQTPQENDQLGIMLLPLGHSSQTSKVRIMMHIAGNFKWMLWLDGMMIMM
jgi:hypothetical protein